MRFASLIWEDSEFSFFFFPFFFEILVLIVIERNSLVSSLLFQLLLFLLSKNSFSIEESALEPNSMRIYLRREGNLLYI